MSLIRDLIKLREKKSKLEEQLKELNKKIETINSQLVIQFLQNGIQRIEYQGYLLFIQNKKSIKVLDKEKLIEIVKEKAPEYLSVYSQSLPTLLEILPELNQYIEVKETPILYVRK
ncbi:MAG: hypothetical protein QXO40_00080 [Candidatus Aenigmatarchaeota archaeon]